MIEKSTILNRTSGGLDVFLHYFGKECLRNNFRNPYRHDTMPSCHLYVNQRNGSGKFWMQDYGDSEWCGDCFAITARINNLNLKSSFSDVLEIINRDLGLGISDAGCSVPVHNTLRKVTLPQAAPHSGAGMDFEVTYKSFTPQELAYWHQYGIDMPTLVKYDVKSVSQCDIKRENGDYAVFGNNLTPCFAYVFNEGKGIKLYRPASKTRFYYCGELPKPYMFGWNQLPDHGKSVFITGGEKDVMSLASHGMPAVSFNSETAIIPDYTISDLQRRFCQIIVLYDSDETGVRESKEQVSRLSKTFKNVVGVTLPLAGTKQEKDISDWYRLGHTSEELTKLLEDIA